MRILLTRPHDQSRATAALLREAGHEALIAPMLRIEPVDAPPFPTHDIAALAVTSARAVEELEKRRECADLQARTAFAVGERTAQALRAAGFTAVAAAAGDATSLARAAIDGLAPSAGTILYPCGCERRGELDQALEAAGFSVRLVELYRARMVEALPADIRETMLQGAIDRVLIYSKRTGEAFLHALKTADIDPATLHVLAISENAGAALERAGARVSVASYPDEPSLLDLLAA
ncbi:uroporphyrinogen-III synthase [Breoghania sp.]|uniref:uroporphyrinogen-III synthase n=1 Tax=Breoghania sp. TaxID=2065378 RepID=UPI002AA77091|nr:uroporphyrinogen-III synthase [Breoghania sp.]